MGGVGGWGGVLGATVHGPLSIVHGGKAPIVCLFGVWVDVWATKPNSASGWPAAPGSRRGLAFRRKSAEPLKRTSTDSDMVIFLAVYLP